MSTTIDRAAFRFFLANAGYCTPPGRVACAAALARAEARARDLDLSFVWRHDEEGIRDWDCHDGCQPERVLGCVVYAPADVERTGDPYGQDEPHRDAYPLASLWGIGDPSREYRRVVEAELAAEALAEHDRLTEEAA